MFFELKKFQFITLDKKKNLSSRYWTTTKNINEMILSDVLPNLEKEEIILNVRYSKLATNLFTKWPWKHYQKSFPLSISWVYANKSAETCGIFHIY